MTHVIREIAGRTWQWTADDRACWQYLQKHWRDATAGLSHVPLTRRRVCVQAGGNFGVWPWLLSPHFEEVLTFEPNPTNFALMRQNLAGTENVFCLEAGLGASPTKAQMHMSRRNHGAHRIKFDTPGDIEVMTLDSLALTALDLLDLDIEGAEPYALEGAKETIAKYRPTVVIEQWKAWDERKQRHSRGHEKELYDNDYSGGQWLLDHGYKLAERITQDEVYVPA